MTTSKDDSNVVSLSGTPILLHGEEKAWEEPQGEERIEAISPHIEAHPGPVDGVFHETLSDTVNIDIHIVPPTAAVPFRHERPADDRLAFSPDGRERVCSCALD